MSKRLAARIRDIQPFHVMAILARARELEAQGRSIIHMEIGEPDFATLPAITEAGMAALRAGRTHYTPALGLPALRQAIAQSYPEGARPEPQQVIVTAGASGALQLVFGALIDPGDEVLLADPGYPCNRHFVRLFGGQARAIAVDASTDYQLTAELIDRQWSPRTRAVLLSTPSNPTGTIIKDSELQRIIERVNARNGVVIVDEIYHGLVYGDAPTTALGFPGDVFVVNSFSKYYGMTGWRVGWLVAPGWAVPAIDKLAQNIFLAASTPAQYAALAALAPETQPALQERRDVFRARRDFLLPALREIGFHIPTTPQGAFYLYADCSRFSDDSEALALALLEQAGVAVTPGRDFGDNHPERYLRFSYANTLANLSEGAQRLTHFLR